MSDSSGGATNLSGDRIDAPRSGADGGELIALPPEVWRGLRRPPERLGDKPTAPPIPLSMSDLLVNAEGQPNIGSELRLELESADSVDPLCAVRDDRVPETRHA